MHFFKLSRAETDLIHDRAQALGVPVEDFIRVALLALCAEVAPRKVVKLRRPTRRAAA